MDIEVVSGAGEGGTKLGAFDTALADAGIHNYNLVTLSSVIPPAATVTVGDAHDGTWGVGDVIGVVLSETRSAIEGQTISAGLGWATATEGGVFFEATSESEANVEQLLRRGIRTAKANRPEWSWEGSISTRIVSHTVDHTGAALVAGVYGPVGES